MADSTATTCMWTYFWECIWIRAETNIRIHRISISNFTIRILKMS